MPKKVKLHLISIFLPWEVQWFDSWWHLHHVMLTLGSVASSASHDQKSCVAPHFDYLDLRNAMLWCLWWCHQHHMMLAPVASYDQKSHGTPQFNCLNLGMQLCHWWHWCQWCNMTKKVKLHLISIVLLWKMQWFHSCFHQHHVVLTLTPHDQESNVAHHFNCLDLKKAMLPFLMLLALCDGSANGGTWPKESCCNSFQLSLPKENSYAIYDNVGILWHW